MNCTASELAQYLGAVLSGDPHLTVSGVARPESASATDLIYLVSPRHRARASASAAVCVLASPGVRLPGKTILELTHPKFGFAKAAALLLEKPAVQAGVHPTALIASSAKLEPSVTVGPYAVIEEQVDIGAGTAIGAFCYLGHASRIGTHCRLHPRVTVYPGARLGDRVEIHSGAVVGSDGFGYVFGEGRQWKFPQIGSVQIGDDVEVGANTTIDRGALESTRIGNDVKIDNLVQIAHNVQIGEHSVVAAQTGVSGSSAIGEMCVVGGQVGIADHCRIEDRAILGAQAGIPTGKTIRRGQTVWGTPARTLEKFKQQYALFAKLPVLAERIRKLEEKSPSH